MTIDLFADRAGKGGYLAKTTRGGAITLTAQLSLFAIHFLGTIIFARFLSPLHFGLIAMVTSVLGFLDTFKDLGLSAATIQAKTITQAQVSFLFWINLLAGSSLAVLCAAGAPLLAHFYSRPELTPVTLAIALAFVATGYSAQHYALLRRNLLFGRTAAVDISSAILGLAAGVGAAWLGMEYWSLVVQRLTTSAVAAIGVTMATRWKPSAFAWAPDARQSLRFGSFLALNNILTYASRNVDNIAIGRHWGPHALGIYSRAYSLLMLPISNLCAPLVQVAIPVLSRMHDEPERFRRAYLKLGNTIALAVVPLVAVLLSCSDAIVLLLLGPQWSRASEIYLWLGPAAVIQPVTSLAGILFLTSGRSDVLSRCTLINSSISVASILLATPWGPEAVAAAYSISALVIRTPILFRFAGRHTSVGASDLYSILLPWLLVAGVIFGASAGIRWVVQPIHPLSSIAIATVTGLLVVGAAVLIVPSLRSAANQAIDSLKSIRRNQSPTVQ